jgi:glycerate dehydrogenase
MRVAEFHEMKIVVLDSCTLSAETESWAALKAFGEVEVHDRSSTEEIGPRARAATVLIANKADLPAEVLEQAPALRLIAVTGTGYDCVDVAAASRRGVAVANVPSYGTDSVAQFAFALLLELCHRVGDHARAVREGEWSRSSDFCYRLSPLIELAGKTLGVVGFGRIGRRVGELAHAFGMSVLAVTRSSSPSPAYQPFEWTELEELFRRSDVISLHCPLTPETAGMVQRDRLSQIKPGAFLINTSRGGLVVERDLADALNDGRLAGAAVYVVSREPIQAKNPLLTARNCLITPHIAWATNEARRRLLETTIANVAAFLAGQPRNIVNAAAAQRS